MVSVIIPIYNIEKWLSQCLDSVVGQSYTNLQIILVDDGSTDNCPAICDEYASKDPRIEVIHKTNGGLSDARNAGINIAKGDYIFFLDGDDWIDESTISILVSFAEEYNCDIVQAPHIYAFKDRFESSKKIRVESEIAIVLSKDEAMRELLKNDYIKSFAWGKLYKAELVKMIEFPVGKYFEDSFWQHIIFNEIESYGIVNTNLYYYRQREDSISGSLSLKNIDLLSGLYERFVFIKEKQINLSKVAAKSLWKAIWSMETNKQKSVEIKNELLVFEKRILRENGVSFNNLLLFDYRYQTLRHFRIATPTVYLFERLLNRIHLCF